MQQKKEEDEDNPQPKKPVIGMQVSSIYKNFLCYKVMIMVT